MSREEELMILGLSYFHMQQAVMSKKHRNVSIEELSNLVDTYRIELEHKLEHGVLDMPEFFSLLKSKYGVDDG